MPLGLRPSPHHESQLGPFPLPVGLSCPQASGNTAGRELRPRRAHPTWQSHHAPMGGVAAAGGGPSPQFPGDQQTVRVSAQWVPSAGSWVLVQRRHRQNRLLLTPVGSEILGALQVGAGDTKEHWPLSLIGGSMSLDLRDISLQETLGYPLCSLGMQMVTNPLGLWHRQHAAVHLTRVYGAPTTCQTLSGPAGEAAGSGGA